MAADKRRLLWNGEPLGAPPSDLAGLLAQGAKIIVGPGAFDELDDNASEDGLTIAARDPVDLALPATAMRSASLSYQRAMPGPIGRQPNAAELQLWQEIAAAAGLSAGGAMMFWIESVPGMTVLVVWPEGRGAHSSEVVEIARRLDAACGAKFGARPPPGASLRKGLGRLLGWLVLLAMAGAGAYFVWGMG